MCLAFFGVRRNLIAIASIALMTCAQDGMAQQATTNHASAPLIPLIGTAGYGDPSATFNRSPATGLPARGPLARLVRNPDETSGAPPFALTDRSGTIQRYVEPVPGIDLDAHVGQVVVVRHDTGATLLASQLELPPPAMLPMLGQNENGPENLAASPSNYRSAAPADIQQVQYTDGDDTTVELLPENSQLPGEATLMNSNFERSGTLPLAASEAQADANAGEVIGFIPEMQPMYPRYVQYAPRMPQMRSAAAMPMQPRSNRARTDSRHWASPAR